MSLAFLYAWAATLAQEVEGGGGFGILWLILVVLLIICAIVWLVRRR